MALTAQQFLDRWASGISSNTQKIKDGIQRVNTAPGQKAAAKKDKMRAGINAAFDSGKWEAAVSGVSLSDWQNATIAKVSNVATGASAAKNNPRVVASVTKNLANIDAAKAAVESMPTDTIEQRIQKGIAFQMRLHELSQQGK